MIIIIFMGFLICHVSCPNFLWQDCNFVPKHKHAGMIKIFYGGVGTLTPSRSEAAYASFQEQERRSSVCALSAIWKRRRESIFFSTVQWLGFYGENRLGQWMWISFPGEYGLHYPFVHPTPIFDAHPEERSRGTFRWMLPLLWIQYGFGETR